MPVKKVIIEKANRLYQLPPDLLSFTRHEKKQTLLKKTPIIDLARFDWPVRMDSDRTPKAEEFRAAGPEQIAALKEDLAGWYRDVHGAKLNPIHEIFIGGSIAQSVFGLALAFIDNGDIAFVPDLGLPLYRKVITACGGEAVGYSVSHKRVWQPDFERVRTRLGRVARLLFVNSPHNPTGAELSLKDLDDLVWMASRENIVIVNDAAYQSLSGRPVASLLAIKGGRKIGVEVGSFSYGFGLPALPFGFVAGSREVIAGLEATVGLIRPYIPSYYVSLAREAIRKYPTEGLKAARELVAGSEAEAGKFMNTLGLEPAGMDSVPFAWARIEKRARARRAARTLYRRGRILVVPGNAFGENGQGFFRLSLTAGAEAYRTAAERLKRKRNLLETEETE